MGSLVSLALSPFAAFFRLCYAYPWPSIIGFGVLAVVAYLIGRDGWSVSFVFLMSYMMIWLDETAHPRAIDEGVVAGD